MKCNIIINVDYVKITFVNSSNSINICDYKYVDANSTVNIPVEFLEDADETCVSTSVGTLSSTMLTIPVTTENITVTLTNAKAQVNVDSQVPYHITSLTPARQYVAPGGSAEVELTYETGYTASDLYATLGQVSNGVLTIPVPQDAVRMSSTLYRANQETLELGTSSSTYGRNVPTDNSYKYGVTQQLYLSSELLNDSFIRAISFKRSNAQSLSQMNRSIDIYLENTSASSLSGFQSISQATLVYSGTVNFAKGDWSTIQFTHPFEYNSSKNLLVTVIDTTGTFSAWIEFLLYQPSGDTTVYARYAHRDSEAYIPSEITSYSSTESDSGKPSIKLLKDTIIVDEPDPEPVIEPTVIGIHDTSSSSRNVTPIATHGNYSLSEQIYLADEINNQAGLITKISFHIKSLKNTQRTWEIYMMHTNQSVYTNIGGSDAKGTIIPISDGDLVFVGDVNLNPDNNWVDIELTTPFEYDGTRNLCIVVYDKTGTTTSSSTDWYTYDVSNYTTLTQLSSTALDTNLRDPNASSWIRKYKNAIRLYMLTE